MRAVVPKGLGSRQHVGVVGIHLGGTMAEESWHEARLIPTSGINGAEEQERRATSALLAVLTAVKEFGRGFVKPFGAPAGTLETYIEVPFILGEQAALPRRPDPRHPRRQDLDRAGRGQDGAERSSQTEQLENYLDIAREQGFDAVITISNEIPAVAGQHPTKVDKRKLRKVALHHVSWSQVLAEAVMQKEFRGVADPDQAWILGELIRYLEHRKSGALEFDDMGEAWVGVRDQVAAGTLRATDKGIAGGRCPLRRAAALRQSPARPQARYRGRTGPLPQGARRPRAPGAGVDRVAVFHRGARRRHPNPRYRRTPRRHRRPASGQGHLPRRRGRTP